MLKNATPHQITLYSVLASTFMLSVGLLLIHLLGLASISIKMVVALAIFNFLASYMIMLYALRTYIYRKVKLIYKSIHRFKVSAKDKNREVDMNTDIIGEVEKEVSKWITDQNKEIETLKSMEAYRRNFMGDISHELKTPIFNIQGYVHTLLDGGLFDEDINVSYLEKASKNVERLQTIVTDLEVISRMEAGELMLEMQEFDIKELAAEVFEDLEIKSLKKDIRLFFKDGADRSYLVNGDRENIRQVLTNLVANSIKYGKQGGQTKIAFYDMDKYILVEVADNGIGIAEEHLNRVFDRFYRVDKSRSRAQGGSGLGLSIVKHIIEAHKQTINVRSSPSLGSTFGFTLAKA
ncbi:MAG: ATP-binding protein [Bacteroidota bacterium]